MKNPSSFGDLTTIAELVQTHPQVIPVFFNHRMYCVGCRMSVFETPIEAARVYGLDPAGFLHELDQAIRQG